MWNKIRVSLIAFVSAALGAGAVIAYNQSMRKPETEHNRVESVPKVTENAEEHFSSILKDQEKLFKNFDSMFDDNFFRHDDPFEEMRKFRDRLGKRFKHDDSVFSSPFDSWYGDKFGGGSVEDITKREDKNYVYYDIKLAGVEGTSVKTNVENGYLTITGEVKKSQESGKGGKMRSFYQSSFRRSFPLPGNVIGEKMEMVSEKDKLVLKFPKRAGLPPDPSPLGSDN